MRFITTGGRYFGFHHEMSMKMFGFLRAIEVNAQEFQSLPLPPQMMKKVMYGTAANPFS